jgi:hypothetical protein
MKQLKNGKESSASQSKIEVEPGDLDVILSAGLIVQGKLKDLIALRESVRKDLRFHVIYCRNASVRLYIVTEDDFLLLNKIKEGLEKKSEPQHRLGAADSTLSRPVQAQANP